MSGFEIWLLALGLAMDCFAVSIASGIILKRTQWSTILTMAFFFGLFQAGMPLPFLVLYRTLFKKVLYMTIYSTFPINVKNPFMVQRTF